MQQKAIALLLCFFFLVVVPVSSLAAHESGEEEDILEQLQKERATIPYMGTLVSVIFPSPVAQSATFLVYSLSENIERREQLSPADKSGGIILLDGTNRWEYIPSHHVIIKTPLSFHQGSLLKNLQLIKQNYTMEKIGEGQIAKRYTLILKFTPRIADRPQRLVWIDKEYKFPVRVEVYGVNGDLSQFMTFTHITFHPTFPEATFTLRVPEDTTVLATEKRDKLSWKELKQFISFSPLFPQYLPPGFVLEDIKGEKSADVEMVQLLYTDGLSYLSIFQEKQQSSPSAPTTLASSPLGSVQDAEKGKLVEHGLLQIVTGQKGDLVYSMVGEVTREELKKVAHSLTAP